MDFELIKMFSIKSWQCGNIYYLLNYYLMKGHVLWMSVYQNIFIQ